RGGARGGRVDEREAAEVPAVGGGRSTRARRPTPRVPPAVPAVVVIAAGAGSDGGYAGDPHEEPTGALPAPVPSPPGPTREEPVQRLGARPVVRVDPRREVELHRRRDVRRCRAGGRPGAPAASAGHS
ncbi:hypothetical protein THAOC_23868, partial [Thalassiosira oceanica]